MTKIVFMGTPDFSVPVLKGLKTETDSCLYNISFGSFIIEIL